MLVPSKTTASLMLQTIMVLVDKQNSSMNGTISETFNDDADLERCYGIYGCFSKGYPWTENRPGNNFPELPDKLHIRYAVFTRRNRDIPVLLKADDYDRIKNANIDPRGPFYLISHGYLESGDKPWIQNITNLVLNLEGNAHATVIVVDWRAASQPPYTQCVANIRLIGVMTAHFINNLCEILEIDSLDDFHYVGHSLGAHLGGYIGHALQTIFNMTLGRITGLDPAAPFFSETVPLVSLDRSDAKYVDIIHSNGMPLYNGGSGVWESVGHVDFFPNGGALQPGCKSEDIAPLSVKDDVHQFLERYLGCNHQRSFHLFVESIAPSCPFWGIQCDSYESFLAGKCGRCDKEHLCLPVGFHSGPIYKFFQKHNLINNKTNIAVYGLTGETKPYCRIHYEVTVKISNSTKSRLHGPDFGKISITLVDENGKKSDHKVLDEEQKHYKPGDLEKRMISVSGGRPPVAVIVEFNYETNLFNPLTWRFVNASSIYVDYMNVYSMEYNTEITVCPMKNKPVTLNSPNIMKPKYCKVLN